MFLCIILYFVCPFATYASCFSLVPPLPYEDDEIQNNNQVDTRIAFYGCIGSP